MCLMDFQKDIFDDAADHLLRMIASSRIEERLVFANSVIDGDFLDVLHKYAYNVDIT
ncbi:hypothetical protein AAVH_29706, partial [Aphelenchoides avenae]